MINRLNALALSLTLVTGLSACAGMEPEADAGTPVEVTVVIDTGSGPGAPVAVDGPAGMTVEDAMQLGGFGYTATWFPSVGGYAMALLQDTPASTDGSIEDWLLCINGTPAELGMSAQRVAAGDVIGWAYGGQPCP